MQKSSSTSSRGSSPALVGITLSVKPRLASHFARYLIDGPPTPTPSSTPGLKEITFAVEPRVALRFLPFLLEVRHPTVIHGSKIYSIRHTGVTTVPVLKPGAEHILMYAGMLDRDLAQKSPDYRQWRAEWLDYLWRRLGRRQRGRLTWTI